MRAGRSPRDWIRFPHSPYHRPPRAPSKAHAYALPAPPPGHPGPAMTAAPPRRRSVWNPCGGVAPSGHRRRSVRDRGPGERCRGQRGLGGRVRVRVRQRKQRQVGAVTCPARGHGRGCPSSSSSGRAPASSSGARRCFSKAAVASSSTNAAVWGMGTVTSAPGCGLGWGMPGPPALPPCPTGSVGKEIETAWDCGWLPSGSSHDPGTNGGAKPGPKARVSCFNVGAPADSPKAFSTRRSNMALFKLKLPGLLDGERLRERLLAVSLPGVYPASGEG